MNDGWDTTLDHLRRSRPAKDSQDSRPEDEPREIMSEKTKIAWCDSTLNFWSGCTKVSSGCVNCYAEALSNRQLGNIGKWGKGAPRQFHESAFKLAARLNKKPWVCNKCGIANVTPVSLCACPESRAVHRRRIFSLSLGDWLDDEVPIEWLARMLDTIRKCDQVTWILCTKRPENWLPRMKQLWKSETLDQNISNETCFWFQDWMDGHAPKNIILLASVENQPMADKRIPELLKIPAACRGLSMEPLLGPVEFSDVSRRADAVRVLGQPALSGIHWLIIGGESGAHARPCNVEWIRSLVAQGRAAGVATFVKQIGARSHWVNPEARSEYDIGGDWFNFKDKKGGDPSEWPEDLRIQEWPKLP
jgi:protein gp37